MFEVFDHEYHPDVVIEFNRVIGELSRLLISYLEEQGYQFLPGKN
jgi:hypothetical protein